MAACKSVDISVDIRHIQRLSGIVYLHLAGKQGNTMQLDTKPTGALLRMMLEASDPAVSTRPDAATWLDCARLRTWLEAHGMDPDLEALFTMSDEEAPEDDRTTPVTTSPLTLSDDTQSQEDEAEPQRG